MRPRAPRAWRALSLAAAVAVTVALTLVGGAAFASAPYTVAVGGSTAPGTHVFTATTSTLTTSYFSCTSTTIGGSVTSGPSGVNPILVLSSLTASGCGGYTITGAVTPFPFYGTDPVATTGLDDVHGELDDVAFHVQAFPIPAVCNYDVAGFVPGDFDESTQSLNLAGSFDLIISNVAGCGGRLADGDPFDLSASFPLSVSDGSVNISWPPDTVSVGGSSAAGSHSFTGAGTSLDLVHGTTNVHCTGVTAAGTATSGPGGIAGPFLTLTALAGSGCSGSFGPMVVTQVADQDVHAVGPSTAAATDDVATESDVVLLHVRTAPIASVCSFDVVGLATGDFDEPTQSLNLHDVGATTDLVAANVTGCLGELADGDWIDATASVALSTPDGPINLS